GPVARAGPRRIGISVAQFDDMGKLLRSLGDGYRFETIPDEDFLRPESLDSFDILFLTCNGFPSAWAKSSISQQVREGVQRGTPPPDIVEKFGETLRRFVNRGGTLYASDLREGMLVWAFPDRETLLELDLAPLRELDRVEREWLKVKVPLARVGTIAETL